MSYRNANYSAFYVSEPFSESNLGAYSTTDFIYYNMLRMWKGKDNSFPFIDAHEKTYNVRHGSDWESTLKPRLHVRLDNSKNIILYLSSITNNSRALREEMNYGMGKKGLPVIVIYSEYDKKSDIVDSNGNFKKHIIEFILSRNLLKTPYHRAIIFLGCHQDGGRLALFGGTVTLRLHRNPKGNQVERRATLMLTIEGLLAVLSFGLTCFSIGYAIGRNDNHKTQK